MALRRCPRSPPALVVGGGGSVPRRAAAAVGALPLDRLVACGAQRPVPHCAAFSNPPAPPPRPETPGEAYTRLLAAGELRPDEHQAATVRELQALYDRVVPARAGLPFPSSGGGGGGGGPAGLFDSLFGGGWGGAPSLLPPRPAPHVGMYIWGGTGSGKTRLMDMFYDCVPGEVVPKRRAHFHSFMLDVHARLHGVRTRGLRGDPLIHVSQELLQEGKLLCFDEFQVTDVGDAMIMKRLFHALWGGGLVMVATSNRPPAQLYHNGLQRDLFLPFLDDLLGRCSVHKLDSPTDYRLVTTPLHAGKTWLTHDTLPPPPVTPWQPLDAAMDRVWAETAGGETRAGVVIDVRGRPLTVPRAVLHPGAPSRSAARFPFSDLCGQPLYAADYQALAHTFGAIFVDRVPLLDLGKRNEVRRFITLVDVMYDAGVRLVVSAAAPPPRLFNPIFPDVHTSSTHDTKGAAQGRASPPSPSPTSPPSRLVTSSASASSTYDEVFAWDRAVSRLLEMQSEEYLSAGGKGGLGVGAQVGGRA